eukprot:scaffold1618_cov397-Prasinococcus_capsulatus_cf.AAC.14
MSFVRQVVKNFKSDETFVLYLCGTPPPAVTDIPDDTVTSTAKFFQIPVATMASAETVSVNFIEHLDLEDVRALPYTGSRPITRSKLRGCMPYRKLSTGHCSSPQVRVFRSWEKRGRSPRLPARSRQRKNTFSRSPVLTWSSSPTSLTKMGETSPIVVQTFA